MVNFAIIAIVLALSIVPTTLHADEWSGFWVTGDGRAVIELIPDPQALRVVLRAVVPPLPAPDPEAPPVDANNPDARLRQRPLADMELGSLTAGRSGDWTGRLYDPESGNSFRATVKRLEPGLIEVRGYLGIPALGRTMHWVSLERHRQRQQRLWAVGKRP
jgi:uncharacterized protein (DUF2147 family)